MQLQNTEEILEASIRSIQYLNEDVDIKWVKEDHGKLTLTLPDAQENEHAYVVRIDINDEP